MISGNTTYGVEISEGNTSKNVVAGNRIGIGATGTITIPNGTGIEIDTGASGNTIGGPAAGSGNVISGNDTSGTSAGVYILDSPSNVIAGNKIGTDSSGTIALPNFSGVVIYDAPGNTIGGTVSGDSNLISGNSSPGIYLYGAATTGTIIAGNKIGTDVTGTVALANDDGIDVFGGASDNTIGGTASGAANLISGNAGGVNLSTGATGNVVAGNKIGTDITGTVAVPNVAGISVLGTDNTIGGTAAGAGNLISGNETGVEFELSGTGNIVEGNLIGTDITGQLAVPNQAGVEFNNFGGDTVGGAAAGAGNVISGNANYGVYLREKGSTGIVVLGNLIGTNSTGTAALPNGIGVLINLGASDNTIGGTALAREMSSPATRPKASRSRAAIQRETWWRATKSAPA